MDPAFNDDDIVEMSEGRYRFAQPICPLQFLERLPPLSPAVANLLVADTSHCYPEDRSISESIPMGHRLAQALILEISSSITNGLHPADSAAASST